MHVTVMGFPVKVIFTDDLPAGEYGHCDPARGEIRVSAALEGRHSEAVVFHELAHFIWNRTFSGRNKISEEEFCTKCELFATVSENSCSLGLDKR